jgi:hypothetical protein
MRILESLATEALRLGFDTLEVEYKDGFEEVCVEARHWLRDCPISKFKSGRRGESPGAVRNPEETAARGSGRCGILIAQPGVGQFRGGCVSGDFTPTIQIRIGWPAGQGRGTQARVKAVQAVALWAPTRTRRPARMR